MRSPSHLERSKARCPLRAKRSGHRVDVAHKPSSVSCSGRPGHDSDHSSRTSVTGRLEQPTRRHRASSPSPTPEGAEHDLAAVACLRGLAPDGVYRAVNVTAHAVGSYPAVSPLPCGERPLAEPCAAGGLFSVALSSAFPPPGVTRHRTLWSSDFPPASSNEAGDRLRGVDGPFLPLSTRTRNVGRLAACAGRVSSLSCAASAAVAAVPRSSSAHRSVPPPPRAPALRDWISSHWLRRRRRRSPRPSPLQLPESPRC